MTARLPKPGGDTGDWGTILNTFLEVAHNSDGSLKAGAITTAGAGTYSKPSGGIPASDLASSVQTDLSQGANAVQLAGDLGGTVTNPIVASIQGVATPSSTPISGQVLTATGSNTTTWQVSPSAPVTSVAGKTGVVTLATTDLTDTSITSPTNNQVLTYNSGATKWENAAAQLPGNATSGAPGLIQLTGDLGNSATNPQVTSTHLSAALPIAQGGTASTTQNFVDLTTTQNIGGNKTFTGTTTTFNGEVIVPTPTNNSDAATKAYVDSTSEGLDPKQSVAAATITNLPANTYNNGTSGVGATLTATTNGALTIDSYSVNTNDRLLVQNEATQANNGIYVATNPGSSGAPYVLTRSTDFDQSAQVSGAYVFVDQGTTNANAGFVCTSTGSITFGSTAITWTQFSGAGEITAGAGLSKSGNTLSLMTPVPLNQGGTGATTQNFVDLTTNQTIAGTKTFSSTITGNISGNAGTVTTIPGLTGDVTSSGNATTVAKIQGVTISGTPSANQVLTATGSSAASWSSAGSAPTGSAGGDLSGTYPNPTVAKINGVSIASGGAFASLQPSGDTTGATDATAVNAAVTAGYQQIILGPGQWYFGTNRISLTAGPGVKLLGSGSVMNDQSSTNATVINAGSSSSATGVFFFSHTATLISGTEIGNLDIVYSGTGNVFDDVNCQSSYFHDLNITMSQGAAMAFAALTSETANNSVIQVTLERVTISTTASTRSNPMIDFTSENSGGISDVSFIRCKFNNTGQDHTQPCVLVQCTATGAGYHYATTFRDCYFEKPLGGAIKSLSGSGLLVDHCMFWDMSGLTVGASTVYVGAASGNIGSQGVKITGCGRNRNGANGSSTWDIECESTTSQVMVEGYHILANSQSTQTNAFFNFHGCNDVILMGNVSPQGSAVNGNSTTVVTNPSPTQVTLSAGVLTATSSQVDWLNVKSYGATGNGQCSVHGAITSGQNTLSISSDTLFQSTDVGKLIVIDGAGGTNIPLATTISGFTNSSTVTLSNNAAATVSGATVYWGTDDTTAIQSAITAAQVSINYDSLELLSNAQAVFLPYGIYMTSTALSPQQSKSFVVIGDQATIVGAKSALIDFKGASHLLEGVVMIEGIWFEGCGGHIFQNANIHGEVTIQRCNFVARNVGYGIWYQDDVVNSTNTALYKATFRDITYWIGSGTRSVEPWHFVTAQGANLTDITFEHVNGPNVPGAGPSNLDNTKYQFYLDSSDTSANGFITNIRWQSCLTASPFGGYIKVGSGKNIVIDGINIYNSYVQSITNDMITFVTGQGGNPCTGITVRNVNRNNSLGTGSPPPPYDLSLASTTVGVHVENFMGTAGYSNGPWINLNACSGVTLISNHKLYNASEPVIANLASDTLYINDGAINLGTASDAIQIGTGQVAAQSAVLSGSSPLKITQGAASGKVLTSDSSGNASWQTATGGGGGGSGGSGLTDTAVKTGAYTAQAGDMVLVDTSTPGAQVTITTPASPSANALFGVKLVKQSGTFGVTVQANSGVTFNDDASTSISIPLLNESAVFQYDSSLSAWMKYYGDTPVSGLDGRYLAMPTGTATVNYVPVATGSGNVTTWSSVPAGPAGPTGLNWRGTYSNTTTYAANDGVIYNGSSFIATAGSTGVNPGTPTSPGTNWNVLSSIGNTGPSGSGLAGITTASDQGYLGWSASPITASGSASQSAGQIWGSKINLPSGTTTGVAIYVNTAATGSAPILAQGENYVGLINSSGSLVANTADCSGQTFTVGTTASSATVSGTGFASTMIGGQYTIAGVTGTFTVASVASSTSLTMTATIPTTVSSATMTPTANFSWLSTGIKYIPWTSTYSLSAGDYYVGILTVLGTGGTAVPKFQAAPTGLPTALIGSAAPTATGMFSYPMSGQLGGLSSQTSIPSSMTLSSTAAVNTTYWLAVY